MAVKRLERRSSSYERIILILSVTSATTTLEIKFYSSRIRTRSIDRDHERTRFVPFVELLRKKLISKLNINESRSFVIDTTADNKLIGVSEKGTMDLIITNFTRKNQVYR